MDAAVARVLFFAIIIVIVVATILLYHVHRKLAGRGHRKALGWLVDPMPIKPYIRGRGNARRQGTAATGSPPRSLARGVKVVLAQTGWRMLFFVILAVIVLVAAEVSIFFHECGHGLVGELVGGSWTQIRIGLLNGTSWTPMSLVESDGEPYFIARSWVVLMGNGMEVIVSTGFLLLLLVPPVRKSFIASLFVLALGVAGFASAISSWYGEAWNVLYGHPTQNSDTLKFVYYQEVLGTIATPSFILVVSTVFMVALQVIIVVATSKVWRQHYPAHRFSHWWVVGVVQAVWWVLFFSRGYWFIPA